MKFDVGIDGLDVVLERISSCLFDFLPLRYCEISSN